MNLRDVVSVLVCGAWINASEFFRNEWLLKSHWVAHYQSISLQFPSAPVNGAIWVLWGFLFASLLFALSRRFGVCGTALIGWLAGFVLMWIVAWNLGVLPVSILGYAVPLSLLEAFVGALICARLTPQSGQLARRRAK